MAGIMHTVILYIMMFMKKIPPFNRPEYLSVADPGFPVGGGGRGPVREACGPIGEGAWTPNVGTFWEKCLRKRKNWVPRRGACTRHAP